MTRARSIEIYLKPGIDEDDLVHRVWEAVGARGRPQETFRRLLVLGIRAAVENGEMPRAGLEAVDLDILMPVGPATALLRAGATRPRQPQQPAPPARPRAPGAQGEEPFRAFPPGDEPRPAPPAPPAPTPPPAAPPVEVAPARPPAPEVATPKASRLGRIM